MKKIDDVLSDFSNNINISSDSTPKKRINKRRIIDSSVAKTN